jgi:hypothetical protein
MKPFRTVVTPQKPDFVISHKDRIVSIGSCFSENIGQKFDNYKFKININPFGQQYNPHSMAQAIERLIAPVPFTAGELILHNEQYHSLAHHGSFSKNTVEETLKGMNETLLKAVDDLKHASVLFLTFGTAHLFKLKETGAVVSNCHKLPGNLFEQELMKPDEIATVLQTAFDKLKQLNPKIKIVLTVSPVRYFTFGAYENSVSKSHLFAAIHALQQSNSEFYYFPAYELIMDDLRDYRFFADDMFHPNQQAIDYVWESLSNTFFDNETQNLLQQIEGVLLALKHRPRNPESEAHKKFVERNLERMGELKREFGVDFSG